MAGRGPCGQAQPFPDAELAKLREEHECQELVTSNPRTGTAYIPTPWCMACDAWWPCDAARLLATLDTMAKRAAEREATITTLSRALDEDARKMIEWGERVTALEAAVDSVAPAKSMLLEQIGKDQEAERQRYCPACRVTPDVFKVASAIAHIPGGPRLCSDHERELGG